MSTISQFDFHLDNIDIDAFFDDPYRLKGRKESFSYANEIYFNDKIDRIACLK